VIVTLTHDHNKEETAIGFLAVINEILSPIFEAQEKRPKYCDVDHIDLDTHMTKRSDITHIGENIRYHIRVSLEEVAFSSVRDLEYDFLIPCSRCRGQGLDPIMQHLCATCDGSGQRKQSHRIRFKVPCGIDNYTPLRIKGMGNIAPGGKARSDLYIYCDLDPHPIFKRDDDNVTVDIALSPLQAEEGVEIEIPLLGGQLEKLIIPPDTALGQSFSLQGRGIPFLSGKGCGNYVVTVASLIQILMPPGEKRQELLVTNSFAGAIVLQSRASTAELTEARLSLYTGLNPKEILSFLSDPSIGAAFTKLRRTQEKLSFLQSQWSIYTEKLSRIQEQMAIVTDVNVKFQYESQLKHEQQMIQKLEIEIEQLELVLQTEDELVAALKRQS
jgi:DnaJ-class molecular chaperone